MGEWSHFDDSGRAHMVDVGTKSPTRRRAVAEGWLKLPDAIFDALKTGGIAKGDPIPIAEIAGIMGAKKTSDLIPMCHGLILDSVNVRCEIVEAERSVRIECEASTTNTTGVEMEALTGVSIAALVFYDMCKGVDKGMIIRNIRLLEKSGGKSGHWRAGDVSAHE